MIKPLFWGIPVSETPGGLLKFGWMILKGFTMLLCLMQRMQIMGSKFKTFNSESIIIIFKVTSNNQSDAQFKKISIVKYAAVYKEGGSP